MRFGFYGSVANPSSGEHLDRSIDQVIAEAQLAEARGFDSCFFGEHHHYFLLRHAHSGGPPHEKIMEAIKLFGDRVLPYCR